MKMACNVDGSGRRKAMKQQKGSKSENLPTWEHIFRECYNLYDHGHKHTVTYSYQKSLAGRRTRFAICHSLCTAFTRTCRKVRKRLAPLFDDEVGGEAPESCLEQPQIWEFFQKLDSREPSKFGWIFPGGNHDNSIFTSIFINIQRGSFINYYLWKLVLQLWNFSAWKL